MQNYKFIGPEDADEGDEVISELESAGGGICIISPTVRRGTLFKNVPDNILVIDLRYGGATILGGNHPRKEGITPQYSFLKTGLAHNIIVSDQITDETPIHDWLGNPYEMQSAPYGQPLSSEVYRHLHNHYQNFLSEVFNFSRSLNGVAIWGDSGAFVPEAKSWGGFFSARSWPVRWEGYTPESAGEYEDHDFDAGLVGVEVDVLNAGKDWDGTNMGKTGVQIVGFGSRNGAAVEIRTEDTEDFGRGPENRRGAWHNAILVWNALHDNSTLLHCETGPSRRGIDLSKSSFREGALLASADGWRSGVVFGEGRAGQLFGEADGCLVVHGGEKGVRIALGQGEFFQFNPDGSVHMSEQVRRSLRAAVSPAGAVRRWVRRLLRSLPGAKRT